MVLVPASDCLKHKFGANCFNGRNLNVRTVEVQLDSVADIKLLGIKIDNCFKTTVSNIGKRLGLLKRTDKFLLLKVENFVYNSPIQLKLDYFGYCLGYMKQTSRTSNT